MTKMYSIYSFTLLAALGLTFSSGFSQVKKIRFENPVKIPGEINSTAEENMPHISADGQTLYFVRTFHPNNNGGEASGQDIWYSQREGNSWTPPQNNLGELNNLENNAVAGTSLDGNILYLLYAYGTNRKLNRGLAFSYQEESGSWKRPERMKIPNITNRQFHQGYYVKRSGDVIIISMTGHGTIGKEDLYVSVKNEKGKWSSPEHMGNVINSTGYEISPYLSDDGSRLYFSSNGHAGLGEADIFYSDRIDGSWTNWSEPVNLGSEVNSKDFDGYFFIGTNEKAYFSSNRSGELSDLYEVDVIRTRDAKTTNIAGVFEYKNLPQAGQNLYLVDENDQVIQTARTDQYGNFNFTELDPDKNYFVRTENGLSEDAELYLVNDEKEKVALLSESEEGTFVFNSLTQDKISGLPPMVVPSDDYEIAGTFQYEELNRSDVHLDLLDENGELLQSVVTDANGNFVFQQLDPDKKYLIRLAEQDAGLQGDGEVFFFDKTGKKSVTPQKSADGFAFQTLQPEKKAVAIADPPTPKEPAKVDPPKEQDPSTPKEPAKPKEPSKPADPKETPKAQDPKQIEKPKATEPERPIKTSPNGEPTEVIYFAFNSYNLTKETRFQLYKLLATLKANPNLQIVIEGHADNVGPDNVNDRFSEVRAKSTKDYFISRGIDKSRITTKHYGDKKPASSNDTPAARSQNRRVEVWIF